MPKNPQRIQSINVQMKLNRQFSEKVKMDNNYMKKCSTYLTTREIQIKTC